MMPELMEGATPGAVGRVSESGWSNSVLFRDYLENHFLKQLPLKDDQRVLLIVDGHKSHAAFGLVEWAKQKNIILYILPAHTSHILQPLDVGCYGPLQKMYNTESHKFTRAAHCTITRYNVCQLVCKVYNKALSADNPISAFRRTGIHPCNADIIPPESFKPAEVFRVTSAVEDHAAVADADVGTAVDADVGAAVDAVVADADADATGDDVQGVPAANEEPARVATDHDAVDMQGTSGVDEPIASARFFSAREESLRKVKSEGVRKERRTLSKIISGHCITEEHVLKRMNEHVTASCSTSSVIVKKPKKSVARKRVVESESESDCEERGMDEKELCCVCKLHTPRELRHTDSIAFAKWVQCDGERDGMPCMHWTHLKYCTKVRVVRRNDTFFCHHCTPTEE